MKDRRYVILANTLLGTFMSTLDGSIVNVALPVIAKELFIDINRVQWIVTSYLLAVSTLILIFGRIADIKGKKVVYQNGFVVFSLGSLFCGLSHSIEFLIISRIIQASGAAMIMACNYGIITSVFPKNERGKAIGFVGTAVALGSMVGPPLGGFLTGLFSWESIFLINVPIGIAAYFIGRKVLPKDSALNSKEAFDKKGVVTLSISIITIIWALLSIENLGLMNIFIIGAFVISIVTFILFINIERKNREPIVDLSLFENKLFIVSIFCAFISFSAMFCINIIHPFYLQYILKLSTESSGMLLTIFPVIVALVAPISGFLSDKIGGKILTLFGLSIMSIGLILLSLLNENSNYIIIILSVGVMAFGNGLFQAPNNALVMSAVPKNKLGIAGSINALVRNLGMVFGIAVSLALFYSRISYKIGEKVNNISNVSPPIFIYSMRFVYLFAAVFSFLGVGLTFYRIYGNSKEE